MNILEKKIIFLDRFKNREDNRFESLANTLSENSTSYS